MTNSSATVTPDRASQIGDFWGGLASMFVALPSSIAFGIAVYTTLDPGFAGQGAMAGILGAGALGIVASMIGRNGGLISAPCAPAAAVLTALIIGLLSNGAFAARGTDIPLLITLTIFFAALFQLFYGLIGWGRLIKFIPYPVVSGYMSGVGILIALGQLPKLLGLPSGTNLQDGFMHPEIWRIPGLSVGIVTIIVTLISPRFTTRIPATILGLLAGIATYFSLSTIYPELLLVQGNSLIIGPIETSGSFFSTISGHFYGLIHIDLISITAVLVPALTLSVLLSIDTLKTCVVLDTISISRHNSDRVLKGVGIGNLVVSFLGGIPGAGTMGPSLVNSASGGRTPRSGVYEGIFVLLVFLLLRPLIAWVPIGALAGILMVIAWRMFDRSMFHLLKLPTGRLDFVVIAGVVFLAVAFDLIVATGVGVGLAILLFIRDQVKVSIIYRKQYLNQVSSKTRRVASERAIIERDGEQGVLCELQGNLFFGTADQLFAQLEPDLRTKRFILFDLRRVQSIDYTAMHFIKQMQTLLTRRNGSLLFCSLSSALLSKNIFEHSLKDAGILDSNSDSILFGTLDDALEWIENRLLETAGVTSEPDESPVLLDEFNIFRGQDETILEELAKTIQERFYKKGDTIFAKGELGDEIFFVRRGSVRIVLPFESGAVHHLVNIGRADFFGELAFLDQGKRSANAEAKEDCELYVLSRQSFEAVVAKREKFGREVLKRLALTIAEHLRQADAELQLSKER